MKIKLLFAWYDLWIGFFWDKNKSWLYILPIPCFGIILKFPQKRYWLVSNYKGNEIIGSTVKSELNHCCKVDNVHPKKYWEVNILSSLSPA